MLGLKRNEAEVVLALAQTPGDLFDTLIETLNTAEAGRLKDQKLKIAERKIGICLIPFTKFKYLSKLGVDSAKQLLEELKSKQRNIKDFALEAETIFRLTIVQKAVMSFSKCATWEEATRKFPEKTKRDSLLPFINEEFRKGYPECFSTFMRSLKVVEESERKKVFKIKDATAVMMNGDVMELVPKTVDENFHEKTHVALTILDIDWKWKTEELEKFLVAYRNLVFGRETTKSTLVILGPPGHAWVDDLGDVLTKSKIFFRIEKLVIVNTFVKGNGLINKNVDYALVGFMVDGGPQNMKEHIHNSINSAIIINNMEAREKADGSNQTLLLSQKPVDLMKQLINSFTKPGDLVLCPCSGTGTTAIAALEMGRHSMSVEINSDFHNGACRRIQKRL